MKFVVLACLAACASARPQLLPAGVTTCFGGNYPFCQPAAPGATPNLAVPGGGFQYAAEQRILQAQHDLAQPLAATAVPGFAAHQAAEAIQLARQGLVPGSIIHAGQEAKVRQAEADLIALQQQQVRSGKALNSSSIRRSSFWRTCTTPL